MAKVMKLSALISSLITVMLIAVYLLTKNGVLFALAVTAGTFAYHFNMRLLVGSAVDAIMRNRADPNRHWYKERAFEAKLYRFLRVKRWKLRLPTYAPDLFSMTEHTPWEILQAGCQAEIVHEVIVLLSFLPLFFAIPFGEFPVFLITSLLSALFDSLFVILQRYNRPRLLRYCRQSTSAESE